MIKQLALKALDFKNRLNLDDETTLALSYLIFHTWLNSKQPITKEDVHAGNQLASLEEAISKIEEKDLDFLNEANRPSEVNTHFFDELLGYYDPEMRKRLGVWYTPIEVIAYMVRSVDEILEKKFGLGLQSEEVGVLDPATGTGGFISEVIRRGKGTGMYAMELMQSSYMIASTLFPKGVVQLKYGNTLNNLSFEMGERIPLVLGNPPYNKKSLNNTTEVMDLMGAYQCEGSSGALNDDYIKFIRYAQYMVEKKGLGLVAYITNNSFLSSVMMKNMRKSLMECFNEIYVVDFEGKVRDNIFLITQSVCIVFLVRTKDRLEKSRVYYSKVGGSRKERLEYCSKGSWEGVEFEEVLVSNEGLFFYPQDKELREAYELDSFSLEEVFKIKGCGIKTGCDGFVIDPRKENLEQKVGNIKPLEEGTILDMPFSPLNTLKYFESNITSTRCLSLLKQLKAKDQIYLNYTRSNRDKAPYSHILMTKGVMRGNFFLGVHNEVSAPLYEYHEEDMITAEHQTRNFKEDFMVERNELDIMDYIYGWLHDTSYRAKYNDLLKEMSPRVPYPKSDEEFEKYRELGSRYREVHLSEGVGWEEEVEIAEGLIEVKDFKYKEGRLYLNKSTWVKMSKEEWEFRIGWGKVIENWLACREGLELRAEEVVEFKRLISRVRKHLKISSS